MSKTVVDMSTRLLKKRSFSKNDMINLRNGILFISPWIIGFLVFTLYPLISSFYYSFTTYDVFNPPSWSGLDNYISIFTDDQAIYAFYNTVYFAVFSIPLCQIFAIALATLLDQKVRGITVFRTLFYLPSIVPVVCSSVLWLWLFNPEFGIINQILGLFGIQGPGWLATTTWSKPALIIMSLWGIGGGMMIYLAGLQDIPQSLYESAYIDGASGWKNFTKITLPLLSPVILFNLIMGIIGTLQYFTQAFVMTKGGPADSTMFYAMLIYINAFQWMNMGYASAMAWLLFIIILILTLLILRFSKDRVHYQ